MRRTAAPCQGGCPFGGFWRDRGSGGHPAWPGCFGFGDGQGVCGACHAGAWRPVAGRSGHAGFATSHQRGGGNLFVLGLGQPCTWMRAAPEPGVCETRRHTRHGRTIVATEACSSCRPATTRPFLDCDHVGRWRRLVRLVETGGSGRSGRLCGSLSRRRRETARAGRAGRGAPGGRVFRAAAVLAAPKPLAGAGRRASSRARCRIARPLAAASRCHPEGAPTTRALAGHGQAPIDEAGERRDHGAAGRWRSAWRRSREHGADVFLGVVVGQEIAACRLVGRGRRPGRVAGRRRTPHRPGCMDRR